MSNEKKYKITEVFLTCQGEGFFTGIKSLFIRLHGCNIACSFCDTDFSYFDYDLTVDGVLEMIKKYQVESPAGFKNIVITGGEPLMQIDKDLISAMIAAGYIVQIETNGMINNDFMKRLSPTLRKSIYITCSPKSKNISPEILPHISELKIVHFLKKFTENTLKSWGGSFGTLSEWEPVIYIQPCEDQETGDMNVKEVQEFILSRAEPLKLSIQCQKIGNFE